MNDRKPILYILLTVLSLILVYNYLIAPLLMQNNTQVGMGMHWRINDNYNYFVDMRIVLIIILILSGILLFDLIRPRKVVGKCGKCWKQIESDRWKICPNCGTSVKNRIGDKK